MTDLVRCEIADGIASVTLNRPDALNSFDPPTARALLEAVQKAIGDPSARVIVLSGSGRGFCAGGDVGYFHAAGTDAPAAARELITPIHAAVDALANARQPVIASLHGAVAGAGMSLALSADLAIAAENLAMSLAYIRIGVTPDCGGSWLLPHIVGVRKAAEIALLSDRIDTAEALRLGLVNRVVPADKLEEQTREWARRLAGSAPLALAATKRLLRAATGHSLSQHLAAEQESFQTLAGTADFREGVGAFVGKRKATYRGE